MNKRGMMMRDIIDLNYDWKFKKDFFVEDLSQPITENYESVDLPHSFPLIPFNYLGELYRGYTSLYKKEFYLDKKYRGKIMNIIFDGVAHVADIYLNGKHIGKHEGGYDRFGFNISKYINYGTVNLLEVIVDSNEYSDIPPFGNLVDYLGYGGIYREVRLEILNREHLKNCFLDCFDINTNILSCDIETSVNTGVVDITIYDQEKEIYQNSFLFVQNQSSFECILDNKKLWSVDSPYLYQVKVKLVINQEVTDEIVINFGFRDIKFTKKGFYLNGSPVKLRGLNRHQSYPYVGYAMPRSAQEKDADILKYDLGVNIVRTSHYMQSKHFLNRCDEIGLLVFEEIPGWQYIGGETFRQNTLNNVKAMITRDYNHPSIIMWGVRVNESPDDTDLYRATNALARSLDPLRPMGGVRNFKNSEMFEDVYTYNDFTHDGGEKVVLKPKRVKKRVPYLITEHNGHMFPTKRYDAEPHRIEQALRHFRVLKASSHNTRISGAIGWCMNDYNTHYEFGSGDQVCYHGVLDMFRIPKYAAYVYAAQQEAKPVLEVLGTMNHGDYPASQIESVYVATNLDFVKLYINDIYVNTFYPDRKSKLPHPLIKIDDFIGNRLVEFEGFTLYEAKLAKKIFRAVSKYGLNLPLRYKIGMAFLMFKKRYKFNDAMNLFYKYHSSSASYKFAGYKNKKLINTVIKEPVKVVRYQLNLDKIILEPDVTYDVTRVMVTKLDQNNNILVYAFDPIIVETEGGIDLIGPKEISLQGGAAGFWVRTNGKSDIGTVKVKIKNQILTETIKIKLR
ncbi:MAG: glycoside hydrolase family 2 TIM barrel-domain containing protein [Bacilli bacterium]|nr:glycoside hydrolase family 2 TIM barrel-domain containing protein [Bacilli bacterium]